MSLARGMTSYAAAGAEYAKDDRFAVSCRVYLPGGDAGTEREECFRHHAQNAKKRTLSLSRNAALIFLGAVMFVCLMFLGLENHQRNQLSRQLYDLENSMKADETRIEQLEEDLLGALDPANICVKAVGFGMVASAEENTHSLFLPEIEQFTKAENQQLARTAAGELPLPGVQVSGSR